MNFYYDFRERRDSAPILLQNYPNSNHAGVTMLDTCQERGEQMKASISIFNTIFMTNLGATKVQFVFPICF